MAVILDREATGRGVRLARAAQFLVPAFFVFQKSFNLARVAFKIVHAIKDHAARRPAEFGPAHAAADHLLPQHAAHRRARDHDMGDARGVKSGRGSDHGSPFPRSIRAGRGA